MITSNGARIYDCNNQLISSNDIDKSIAIQLCKIVYLDDEIITQVYQNNQWYINNNKRDNNFFPDLTCLQYRYFDLENFTYTKISKIFFTSKKNKKLYDLQKTINKVWGNKIHINFSFPGCLEVISGNTSKGYGLKLISNLLKISLEHFIAFGDGMNDQDMLSICGKGYIMKNADIHLKNSLPHIEVIESNDNNGVAKCLNEIFIKNHIKHI